MQQRRQERALDLIVHTHLDIFQSSHLREQADILESTGNAQLIDFMSGHALGVDTVDQNGATGWLVHTGQQVEDGGLACTVGTDQTGDLGRTNGNVKAVYSSQTAKVNAQIAHIQHRQLTCVLFTKQVDGGDTNHFLWILMHWCPPPFSFLRRFL